jgi:hypothetical protein
MHQLEESYPVFSPRWGHPDRYYIVINQDALRVSRGVFSATCMQGDNGDAVLSGYNDTADNPLLNVFRNDSIYAPEIVPFALELAWRKWRDGAVSEYVLRSGLLELFSWIDQTARGTPKEDLWSGGI